MTSSQFFNITTIAYFASMVLFITYLISRSRGISLIATAVAGIGFVANSAAILMRWFEAKGMGYDQAPLSNLYESVVFFAWSILFIYLLMDFKYKQRAVGAFVMPFAFLGMAWAQLGLDAEIQPLVPALQSNWLTYHVITCFLGYAAFAVACGASIMYLLMAGRPRNGDSARPSLLPSSKVLDDINYKAIMLGFPLLTLGIVTGAAWANYAWGTYWSWDPKETWSLIVWFIYAAFLHARFTRGWAGKRAAWLSIIGFGATIFCYLGVNLILSGLHSYGG
ncbi:MAG: c-type cytochrome biogenesis protein CcsB [Desulfuromonadaceae bacterium GWC2_58_13]|nr:MAG: c-type cytochrome biogenesis protein CcsB [Desulfuromonadaceae bacterium GWC2_58_13]